MKARVTHLNYGTGYCSATTERSKIVFAVSNNAIIKVGDILEGDFESKGPLVVNNETQCLQLVVVISEVYNLDAPFSGHG